MRKLLITIFLSISANLIYSQNSIDKFALNPKYGLYNSNDNSGFGGGIEANVTINKSLFSVDYYHFNEFRIFGDSPDEYFNQIGIMGGTYFGEKVFRLQLQGGLSTIWGLKRSDEYIYTGLFGGKAKSENFTTVGAALKTGLKINPVHFFGFGVDLQANFNNVNFLYMIMFSVELGRIKNRTRNEPVNN